MKTPWLTPSEALNRPLNRQADEAVTAAQESTTITVRRLGFYIGKLGLLIAQHATSELTDMLPICPIPFTAPWLQGLINLRGNLVPVFDLNIFLQLEKPTVKKNMLLILGQGDAAGALLIYQLPLHLTFTEADKLETLPPLPASLKPFVSSGYEKNGEIWFNFDHLGFFASLATKLAV
jgi:chemotaxis signal transduction protein